MKKYLLLTLAMSTLSLVMQAQPWTPLASGTTQNLISLHFADAQTGYVVGSGGVIRKTTDAGATWIGQNSGTFDNFYSTFFNNAQTGWAVGDGGTIQHTTDGGTNWNPVFTPAGSVALRVVWFLDANVGFIAGGISGTFATIIKTTDGGATWTDISPGTGQVIYGIFFTSPLIGYATDFDGNIMHTTDGGASWTAQFVSPNNLHGIYFTDANTGYVVGGSIGPNTGVILKTIDAGATWSPYHVPQGFLTDIKFSSSNVGVAVGGDVANNQGVIVRTTDAGSTWTMETINPSPTSRQLRVFLPNTQVGFSCGLDGTILKKTTQTAPPQEDPCDVKVIGCIKYELLSIKEDAADNRSYRIRVTNNCANKLSYLAVQLPNGIQALEPLNNSNFTSDGGRIYKVRNPNFSPFYSIRYSTTSDSIANGQSDIFEYKLPAQAADPTFIRVKVRLEPQIYYEAHLNTFYCPIGQTPNFLVPKKLETAVSKISLDGSMMLYPNPNSGVFNFELPQAAAPEMSFQVIDLTGQILMESKMEEGNAIQTVQASELPAGLYFLQVFSDGKIQAIEKFIKQ